MRLSDSLVKYITVFLDSHGNVKPYFYMFDNIGACYGIISNLNFADSILRLFSILCGLLIAFDGLNDD